MSRGRPLQAAGWRPWSLIVLTALCWLTPAQPGAAQGKSEREYQIKAGIILHFISFTEWSSQALPPNSSSIQVCVAGREAYQTLSAAMQGKSLKGKRVAVSLFSGLQDLNGCQVLFVSESERARARTLLDAARSQNILTIGEIAGFTKNGGVINISTRNNKLEFTINPGAAARANLSVSSQLLRLGKVEE